MSAPRKKDESIKSLHTYEQELAQRNQIGQRYGANLSAMPRKHFVLGETADDGTQRTPTTQNPSHPLFIEMQTLYKINSTQLEWRETARWIKFEEDVEEGGNRWSKPHVGTLSLQAIFDLRSLISNGTVVLEQHGASFEQIIDLATENLVNTGKIGPNQRDRMRNILLRRHLHQHEYGKSSFAVPKSTKKKKEPEPEPENEKDELAAALPTTTVGSPEQRVNTNFMRKIPRNAEGSSILSGEVDFLDQMLPIFLRLTEPIILNDLTEVAVPSRFIFILLGPRESHNRLNEIGRSLGTLMSDEIFNEMSYAATSHEDLLAGIDEFLEVVKVLPPGTWDSNTRIEPPDSIPDQKSRRITQSPTKGESMALDVEVDEQEAARRQREATGLTRTGRLFGGFINDVKRKSPWYWSDYKDGLSVQVVASWIFLYFACLSTIITFGGMLGAATGKNMAAMESLVSGLICGIGFGLFSGQPLNVLSSTGPVLVFEKIIYQLCLDRDWDFMTFRFWVGTWMAVILLIMTAVDASACVCYITRFTEENFATLIGVIFIFDSIDNVLSIKKKFPLQSHVYDCICAPPLDSNGTIFDYAKYDKEYCLLNNGILVGSDCMKPETANVFLMSVILFAGTFLISIVLKSFRNANFFTAAVRQFISDFSVLIAILLMTLLDYALEIATPKLEVPSELKPTLDTRSWLIPPFAERNPTWTALVAIIPAVLGTILIFLDQQITAVIINRKEFKLKKGCGYHLDLFVLAALIQICSFMGLPWFVAATVLSLNLVNALKKESETSAPGEKPQFLGVHEQRVTQILIGLTIGLSVILMPILRHIPMPVLFGVFLYMGVATLNGLQFFDRILIMFMPAKYQPDYPYLRKVPTRRVHLFTSIQIICLALLWLIKSFQQTSMLFPVMLVVMIGIRKSLDMVFTRRELKILDDLMPEMGNKNRLGDTEKGAAGCCRKVFGCFNGSSRSQNHEEPDFNRNISNKNSNANMNANKLSQSNMKELEAEKNLLRK